MDFFRQNFEGGGGFVETGLAVRSMPPSTCGKTRSRIYHKLESSSVPIIIFLLYYMVW